MKLALQEAEMALREDEIPIGALVVYNGQIIGRGHHAYQNLLA